MITFKNAEIRIGIPRCHYGFLGHRSPKQIGLFSVSNKHGRSISVNVKKIKSGILKNWKIINK